MYSIKAVRMYGAIACLCAAVGAHGAGATTVQFTTAFDTGFQPQGQFGAIATAEMKLPDPAATVQLDNFTVQIAANVEARSSFTSLVDAALSEGGDYWVQATLLPNSLGVVYSVAGSLGDTVAAVPGQTYVSDFTAPIPLDFALAGGLGPLVPARDPLVTLTFSFNGLDYEGDALNAVGDVRFWGAATFNATYAAVPEPGALSAPMALAALAATARARRAR